MGAMAWMILPAWTLAWWSLRYIGDEGDTAAAGSRKHDDTIELAFQRINHRHGIICIHVAEVRDDSAVRRSAEQFFGAA
jgi:hypothetical protein